MRADFPARLGSIGNAAFAGCSRLRKATFAGIPELIGRGAFDAGTILELPLTTTHGTAAVRVELTGAWNDGPREQELAQYLADPVSDRFGNLSEISYQVQLAAACIDLDPLYREYLKEHAAQAADLLIRRKDMDTLSILLRHGILKEDPLDQAIETAIRYREPEAEAALLEYKNRSAAGGFDVGLSVDGRFFL